MIDEVRVRGSGSLGRCLAEAVRCLRAELGDPTASVVLMTPSAVNGQLAWQALARAGDFIRVSVSTPELLASALGGPAVLRAGLRPEPQGWLAASLGALFETILDPALALYAEALERPGWRPTLVRTVETLEAADVSPAELRGAAAGVEDPTQLLLLAALLEQVAARRTAEGLASSAEVARLARLEVARAVPANRPRAAILLGDRSLRPVVFDCLRDWLADRPVVAVVPRPLPQLEPAAHGLRAAAPTAPVLTPQPQGAPALVHLKAHLFGPPGAAARGAGVCVVRTPDEVRETDEAVRAVQAAVAEGVPLDRIALCPPDANEWRPLDAALRRAGIPAAWLLGPTLAETPPAGLLVLLLDLAVGPGSLVDWYELLRSPSLRLGTLHAEAGQGGDRWRGLLARSGASGGATLVSALEALERALPPDAEEDRAAARSLRVTAWSLAEWTRALRPAGPLGAHARRWAELVRGHFAPSVDTTRLLATLAALGAVDAGPPLSLSAALAALRDALSQTPGPLGHLRSPAVLVAEPMALLGGEFERVILCGLGHGRLPRARAEEALLTDEVLKALAARGARVELSGAVEARERRRLASAVSGAVGSLWVSVPRFELLEGRPRLAGTLALALCQAQLGRRARYADLADLPLAGRRDRPAPADPEDSLGAHEFLLARLLGEQRWGLLPYLAAAPATRRLLAMHRAFDRGGLSPWTGRVSPEILACRGLDGAPLEPWRLARLLSAPLRFLWLEVLGARAPRRLSGPPDPSGPRALADRALSVARAGLAQAPALREVFWPAWEADLGEAMRFAPEVDEPLRDLSRRLTAQRVGGLLRASLASEARALSEAVALAGEPWRLAPTGALFDGEALLQVARAREDNPLSAKTLVGRARATCLLGLAHGVEALQFAHLGGVDKRMDVADARSALEGELRRATRLARRGAYPAGERDPYRMLTAEPVLDLELTDE